MKSLKTQIKRPFTSIKPRLPKLDKRDGLILFCLLEFIVGISSGIVIGHFGIEGKIEIKTEYEVVEKTEETQLELPDTIKVEYQNDLGETVEVEDYPTVEEIDGGGKLEENAEVPENAEFSGLGAIEAVDTSSPIAFKNSTLGKCIIANNYYGAQCVSLARAFWFSYANRDVSTCGTGLAKGMMNCSEQNAGEEFKTIWNANEIIAGTWIVLDGTYTGHVCMALDKPANGYVTCLGENQGGAKCDEGGSATNIIKLSLNKFIGGYIPKSYIPVPIPEVIPETSH